jgi:hypothetical protein
MRFHDFLESLYVSTNIENTANYHPRLASKLLAIQSLTSVQKWWLKAFAFPCILIHYLGVIMGYKEALPDAREVVKRYNDQKQSELEQKKAEKEAEELLKRASLVPEIQ